MTDACVWCRPRRPTFGLSRTGAQQNSLPLLVIMGMDDPIWAAGVSNVIAQQLAVLFMRSSWSKHAVQRLGACLLAVHHACSMIPGMIQST